MDYRYKLRMLGIKVDRPAVLLIDNQSVIANTTLPSSTLKKKHNSIAYHRMREAVAAGIIKVGYIKSSTNLADILTKPIGPADYWRLLTEPLYRRDRAIKGELTDNARSRDQGPNTGLAEATASNDSGNQGTYRYRITLYIESQVPTNRGSGPRQDRRTYARTVSSTEGGGITRNIYCTVRVRPVGSGSNGVEPRARRTNRRRTIRHESNRTRRNRTRTDPTRFRGNCTRRYPN